MRRVILVLALLWIGCRSSVQTTAVGDSGTIRGVVTMTDGSSLPGVTVTLHMPAGDRTMITDAKGGFAFAGVPPGVYKLDVVLAGFNTVTMRVAGGLSHAVGITLATASVAESITVTAAGVLNGVAYAKKSVASEQVEPPADGDAPMVENEYADAQKQPVTTFSIDVDGAAYANVRRFLHDNETPPPAAVRLEEMINYFTYRYPQPADGRPLAISSEVAGCPWAPEHRLLRIGLQAKTVEQWKLAPNNLVFLLDVSGSMEPPESLPLVKSAMRLLVEKLAPTDTVSIVVYAGAAGLALPPTPASDKATIFAALDELEAGGSTAGDAGIELAYKTAADHFVKGGNNRVILATDGDFNVGIDDAEGLTALIEKKRKSGIYLTCIGVGNGDLQDSIIELLADKGNGNYYYLDSIDEAKKVFGTQLTGTLVSVADDVKVQVEFDPRVVASYRQIGYENRALADEDFIDDTKDAGELGSGQSVTALYEIVPAAHAARGPMATVRVRYKEPGAWRSREMIASVIDEGKSAYDASPDTQFAAAVAEFGMLLRDSKYKGRATFADVAALARAMRGEDMEGYREELIRMVETSRKIMEETRVADRR